MPNSKPTPGPWRVGPVDDTRVEDALGNCVAEIDGDYNQPETWPVMEANARLIAAAPDLLAALKRVLLHIERDEAAHGRNFAAGNLARAAIAKARGEA